MNKKSVIYVDSIFLNRALCYTFTKYVEKYTDKFTDQQWDKNINEVNLSKLVKYIIEYSCNLEIEGKYNWQGLHDSQQIDVFVFKLDDFHFSYDLYTENPIMYIGQQSINIEIKTVFPKMFDYASIDFDRALAPLMDLHMSKNRISKTYQSLCIISLDKYFNPTINRFIKRKFPIMRYKIAETCDIGGLILKDEIENFGIFTQDIKYPIARMWGLTHEEL